MKESTKKVILTILNIGIVVANLIIQALSGNGSVLEPLACIGLTFAIVA